MVAAETFAPMLLAGQCVNTTRHAPIVHDKKFSADQKWR